MRTSSSTSFSRRMFVTCGSRSASLPRSGGGGGGVVEAVGGGGNGGGPGACASEGDAAANATAATSVRSGVRMIRGLMIRGAELTVSPSRALPSCPQVQHLLALGGRRLKSAILVKFEYRFDDRIRIVDHAHE